MTRTRFEIVPPSTPVSASHAAGRPRTRGAIAAGLVVWAVLAGGAYAAQRQIDGLLSSLDDESLGQAGRALEQLLARQKDQLAAETAVLADDNRIRATVLAPTFDEATVQDVIEDLRKASGATLLAVLDASGKVKVVTGTGALKQANLGGSSSVKAAFTRPASDVWTLPDQVQVIGIAPIRSGEQTMALLVKGLPLGRSQLSTVEATLGVTGAVFVGERLAASSAGPESEDAFRTVGRLAEGTERVSAGGQSYLARMTRTSEAANSARVAWLIPWHHHLERARLLLTLVWAPVALGAALLLILIVDRRRTNGGNA
jgi:hypothetical protein